MARTRSIKPSLFSNEELAEVDPLGRLLFIGLWTQADREGRIEDRPRRIRANVLPYDDCNVDELLSDLDRRGFIIRYEVIGQRLIQIVNFVKHQQPHYKEALSVLSAPEGWTDSGYVAAGLSEIERQAVLDKDGRQCVECGETVTLSVDHATSRKNGGRNDDDNLRTLCRRCNSSKGKRNVAPSKTQGQVNIKSSSANVEPTKSLDDSPEPGNRISDNGEPDTGTGVSVADATPADDGPSPFDVDDVDTRSPLAIVIDTIKAIGLTITTTGRDGKALKDSGADPREVAECYIAIARGEWGDDFTRRRLAVHVAVESLNGWRARDVKPAPSSRPLTNASGRPLARWEIRERERTEAMREAQRRAAQ